MRVSRRGFLAAAAACLVVRPAASPTSTAAVERLTANVYGEWTWKELLEEQARLNALANMQLRARIWAGR